MIVKFGAKPARSSAGGFRNRLRAKMLAQADSVRTRRLRRWSGWAPMYRSWLKVGRSAMYRISLARSRS